MFYLHLTIKEVTFFSGIQLKLPAGITRLVAQENRQNRAFTDGQIIPMDSDVCATSNWTKRRRYTKQRRILWNKGSNLYIK